MTPQIKSIRKYFTTTDGDIYFQKYLYDAGYTLLWRPAPYQWVSFDWETNVILSFTEGDVEAITYSNKTELLIALKALKKYWINYLGKDADRALARTGELWGFLTSQEINLE